MKIWSTAVFKPHWSGAAVFKASLVYKEGKYILNLIQAKTGKSDGFVSQLYL